MAAASMDSTPAMLPPSPDITPDFENPPNGNHIAIPVISICLALTTVFYSVRCYSRFIKMRTWNAADIVAAMTFILYIPYIWITFRLAFATGYLVHQWNMTLGSLSEFLWITVVGTEIYIPILMLAKIAILLDWMRLFFPDGTRRTYVYRACQVVICINVLYAFIVFIMTNANCTPFSYNWNTTDPAAGECRFNTANMAVSSAVLNFVLDVVVLAIPQRVVWSLKVSTAKKLGVSVIFLVGILGCASALVRLAYVVQFATSPDVSYNFSIVALCSLAEVTCAVLVLCVPNTAKALSGVHLSAVYSSIRSRLSNGSRLSSSSSSPGGRAHRGSHDRWHSGSGWVEKSQGPAPGEQEHQRPPRKGSRHSDSSDAGSMAALHIQRNAYITHDQEQQHQQQQHTGGANSTSYGGYENCGGEPPYHASAYATPHAEDYHTAQCFPARPADGVELAGTAITREREFTMTTTKTPATAVPEQRHAPAIVGLNRLDSFQHPWTHTEPPRGDKVVEKGINLY